MTDTAAIPCYGGPFDGRFYKMGRIPSGYKEFSVKNRVIYLWRDIQPHHIDFDTLDRAARKKLPPGEEPYK